MTLINGRKIKHDSKEPDNTKEKRGRKVGASMTIEASVIIPLLLFLFGVLMQVLFYYHDKNLIAGIAQETVIRGEVEGWSAENIEAYCEKQLNRRLLLFPRATGRVYMEGEELLLICTAKKGKLGVRVETRGETGKPQDMIWKQKRIEKIGELIGEKYENLFEK